MSAMSILAQEGIASLAAGMAGITTTASIARITGRHTTGLTPATTERLPIRNSPARGFRELWQAHLAELAINRTSTLPGGPSLAG
jgi:hypothetical protein